MAGLIWSQSAAADYLFTFDITVNERRFEDSIYAGLPSYSMRYDQGQLDTSYIPQVISTQYRLTTDDLIAGELFNANTLRAYTTDIINLNSQLYTEALAIIPDGYGLGSNPKISNEMYVRETFPTQDPLPVDAWAAAAFQVYGSDVAYIEHDTSNPSRHTFEYAEWEMRTNLNSELLPLDFNHELKSYTAESLLSFMENYQNHGDLGFNFFSVARYTRFLDTTYDPGTMDESYNNSMLDVMQVGYSGTAVLTDISEVPIPASAWLFASGLIGLAGFKRRK